MSILIVEKLSKTFDLGFIKKRRIHAVRDISFEIDRGEIVSLVGESGSGKTTTAKMILRFVKPTEGRIVFEDKDIWRDLRTHDDILYYRKRVHAVFQDPFSSYNPFYPVERTLRQVIRLAYGRVDHARVRNIIEEALERVGIDPKDVWGKYPHQISGGQRQRMMIARCWILKPALIIADEPTSMIDASLRGTIIRLLEGMRNEHGTAIMFITHDLGLAYYISDRIMVMKNGELVESGDPDSVVLNPENDYTKLLVSSIPKLYEKLEDFA